MQPKRISNKLPADVKATRKQITFCEVSLQPSEAQLARANPLVFNKELLFPIPGHLELSPLSATS